MTTPERWNEIDRIFAAALELEPAGRAAFLDEACVGDEQVRKEAERNVFPLLIHADPFYDSLRQDLRFAALLRSLDVVVP